MNTYTRHYRTFRQYFNKNRRTYRFEIKFLNVEVDQEYIDQWLKRLLEPLDVIEITEPKFTYLHENPVEFPLVPFGRLCSLEVELGMSITAEELKMLLFEGLQLPFENFIVYNIGDPSRLAKSDYGRLQDAIIDKYADENPYKMPRLGYDPNADDIEPQELVGTQRTESVMRTMTGKDYKLNHRLFHFINEDKKEG